MNSTNSIGMCFQMSLCKCYFGLYYNGFNIQGKMNKFEEIAK